MWAAGIVSGAKWEGSKVSFDDVEAAEGDSEQTIVAVEGEAVAEGVTAAEDEAPSSLPPAAKRFPFNKCIKAALQQVRADQSSCLHHKQHDGIRISDLCK